MTKREYIESLKNNLSGLDAELYEKEIKYYSDYFDDANDDEKIIEQLGSPEDLAKSILEKYQKSVKSTDENSSSDNRKGSSSGALFYSFDNNKIKSINFNFGAAEVVVIPGSTFSMETRGVEEGLISCKILDDGTLSIVNSKKVNVKFWEHDKKYRVVPRILLTIPENYEFNNVSILMGAGRLETKGSSFSCKTGKLEVGAGCLKVFNLSGGSVDFRCGMGDLEMTGFVAGACKIDCGVGCVDLKLSGNKENYSYDAKVGMGDFVFADKKVSGFGQHQAGVDKKFNHFSVNCGMGSVKITF